MLCGIKHVSRDSKRHSKRLLCLSDSMCCVLAFSKGRCVSQALLRSCQRVASEVLAADLAVSWRWIPSELNVADAGSRIWEYLRHGSEKGLQPCQIDSAVSVRSALHACRLRRRQQLVEPPAGEEASHGTPSALWSSSQAHAVSLDFNPPIRSAHRISVTVDAGPPNACLACPWRCLGMPLAMPRHALGMP